MRTLISATLLALLICGCAGNRARHPGLPTDADGELTEETAYEATGDVRVYYYVKGMMVDSARDRDDMVEQRELYNILANRDHSLYRGEAEYRLPEEVRFLYNSDMYDLLYIFRELGFFDSGNATNIYGDNPVSRADRESRTTRIIAVETIKDGEVNTSYFARRSDEHTADPDRARLFNDCQAVFMQAVAGSLPRGSANYGRGDTRRIDGD